MRRGIPWVSMVLVACGPMPSAELPATPENVPPLVDAGGLDPAPDASVSDAGWALDAGDSFELDGGAPDSGTIDAGAVVVDAGPSLDAGPRRDAGTASVDTGVFRCTQIHGAVQSETWFVNGVFDSLVGANTWQRKGRTGILHWRNPSDPVWNEALVHPCAQGSATPDRVVQVFWAHTTYTTAEFEQRIRDVVAVIRSKVPSARSIVLQPVAWLENCPGSFASDQNQRIVDAIARVVGGDVSAGPSVKLLSCSDLSDPALDRLTTPAAQRVAQSYGAFFGP